MTPASILLLLLIYVPVVMLWAFALTDLAHRRNLSGTAKGLWAVAIVLLPLIGMLVYFITRPNDAVASASPDIVPDTADLIMATDEQITELERLAMLKDDGAITDDEFTRLKAQVLG